ncbi:MAG: OmpA family protein, partial [Bacteroidota bacterium]
LRPDALPELEKLVKLLNDNDNITIQLGSHTDSNGTPEYNDNLSNNRAKAVVKFLADNGIDPSRLSWFGYGERNLLIYPEKSDQDEQDNRRTEFKILSIEFNSLNQ